MQRLREETEEYDIELDLEATMDELTAEDEYEHGSEDDLLADDYSKKKLLQVRMQRDRIRNRNGCPVLPVL